MSTIPEPGKVIDLQSRQANASGLQDLPGELLKSTRSIALKRLHGLASTLFDNIDDALFDLAEKAESNVVQAHYFDGMREVRKKRQIVERVFQEEVARAFADFSRGTVSARTDPNKPAAGNPGELSLALVDENELEENLAVDSMIGKAENRLARPLFALNQRIAVIAGGIKVGNENNPMSPGALCRAFRTALRELHVHFNVTLIVLKLFDRYVMSGVDLLYDEVNAHLVQAGVLPQIRGAATQAPGTAPAPKRPPPGAGPAAGAGQPQAAPAMELPPEVDDEDARALQAELWSSLRGLLANRRSHMPTEMNFGGIPISTGDPGLSTSDLLSALSLLQTQAEYVSPAGVNALKSALNSQAGKLTGRGASARASGAEEDCIDLVGMLFEFIVQDRNLPDTMQALIGRLQIPYLRVALLDRHLFAQKTHPARRLLDELANAAMGWSEEGDTDKKLHGKIKEIVERLLTEFNDDLSIFDKLLEDLNSTMAQHRKRAEIAEQRAAEATRGREKLTAARRTAAKEILQRVDGRNLPEIIHATLTRPWANVLVLTLLRQGEHSQEWRQALRFADELAWSGEPKRTDADRTRLRGLLPLLEKTLRQGLALVAYHENDVRQLLDDLNQCHARLLRGDTGVAPPMSSSSDPQFEIVRGPGVASPQMPANSPPSVGSAEDIVQAALKEEQEERELIASGPMQSSEDCIRIAREIKVGTWIEFTDINGNKERAKLSWISPISSKYLFVNRKGLKVADKTAQALAAELHAGSAVLLADVPLFDRALDAIVERLKAKPGDDQEVVPSPA